MSRVEVVSAWRPATAPRQLAAPAAAAAPAAPPPDPEAVRQAAYAAGFAEGRQAGEAQALAEARRWLADLMATVDAARRACAALVEAVAPWRDAAVQAAAAELAAAACAGLAQADPRFWADWVARFVDALPPDAAGTVALAPAALDVLRQAVGDLDAWRQRWAWTADPRLAWGDVVARWDGGAAVGGLTVVLRHLDGLPAA